MESDFLIPILNPTPKILQKLFELLVELIILFVLFVHVKSPMMSLVSTSLKSGFEVQYSSKLRIDIPPANK